MDVHEGKHSFPHYLHFPVSSEGGRALWNNIHCGERTWIGNRNIQVCVLFLANGAFWIKLQMATFYISFSPSVK